MLAAESKPVGAKPNSPTETDLGCSWKTIVEPVEPFLQAVSERLMRQAQGFDPQIVPYANHALNNSGKNLRPTLVALAAALGLVFAIPVVLAVWLIAWLAGRL